MKNVMLAAAAALGILVSGASEVGAVTCGNGVYRTGCGGPTGAAATVKKPPRMVFRRPTTNVTAPVHKQ